MNDVIGLFEAHGVLAVFIGVFLEQLGAPIPAVPFLMMAGARGAIDGMLVVKALAAASVASLAADGVWFLGGRWYGRRVLGLLCRVSISPDTCVRKSEASFARRGALTLLFAKFIPGVSTLAPPLAGALGMTTSAFLLLDLAGTVLWAGAALAAGLLFNRQIDRLLESLEQLGSGALTVLVAAAALYVAWRLVRRIGIQRRLRLTPRISADELARMMQRGDRVLVLDVRAPAGQPLAGIPGSVQVPLERSALQDAAGLATDSSVVTYCDCPHDASAARAAELLGEHGHPVRVLAGGVSAWVEAGHPLEFVPEGRTADAAPA
jgi:membrane protein DedA with SNARE-associated domain/rhodanese-related sulfurtransferase